VLVHSAIFSNLTLQYGNVDIDLNFQPQLRFRATSHRVTSFSVRTYRMLLTIRYCPNHGFYLFFFWRVNPVVNPFYYDYFFFFFRPQVSRKRRLLLYAQIVPTEDVLDRAQEVVDRFAVFSLSTTLLKEHEVTWSAMWYVAFWLVPRPFWLF